MRLEKERSPIERTAQAALVSTVPEVPFYIPGTDLPARPRYTLKHGDSFLMLDSHGDIGAASGGSDGFFHHDTRFVSRFELRFNDTTPLLLGSNVRDDDSASSADLTNSNIYADGRIVLEKDTIHLVRTTFVWRGTAYQRIAIKNHGDSNVDFELSFGFASDFADIFEVRGERRGRRGIAHPPQFCADEVLLK